MKEKEIKRKFSKIYRKWSMSKEIDSRIDIIALFMSYALQRIIAVTPKSATPTLISIVRESETFRQR
jgi:hypothetical protein